MRSIFLGLNLKIILLIMSQLEDIIFCVTGSKILANSAYSRVLLPVASNN